MSPRLGAPLFGTVLAATAAPFLLGARSTDPQPSGGPRASDPTPPPPPPAELETTARRAPIALPGPSFAARGASALAVRLGLRIDADRGSAAKRDVLRIQTARREIAAAHRDLMARPYERARDLLGRRQSEGPGFRFPEIAPFLDLIEVEIEGLLAGRLNHPERSPGNPEGPKTRVLRDFSPEDRARALRLRGHIGALRAAGLPYDESFRFVAEYLGFLGGFDHPEDRVREPDGRTGVEEYLDRFLANPRLVLWPVHVHFPLALMPRIGFAPVYPVGVTLSPFNAYDGQVNESPASFFEHDLAHAAVMARDRDQRLGVVPMRVARRPNGPAPEPLEPFDVALARAYAACRDVHAAIDGVIAKAPELTKAVHGILSVILHENFHVARCDPSALARMIERRLPDSPMGRLFREEVENFSRERDAARVEAAARKLLAELEKRTH